MRAIGESLVKNPVIVEWARRSLIVAGAAAQCRLHGVVRVEDSAAAVRRTVLVARLNSFEGLSPNAAELAILETYLQMPEPCAHCMRRPQPARTAFRAD